MIATHSRLLSRLVFAALAFGFSTGIVHADATLSAQYFEVGNSANPPDFGGGGTPNVAPGSALGPNGFPVVTSPFGISDVDSSTQEITWWSPALNSAIQATGTSTVTLPYASNMYAPNSTGTDDASFFETAVFKGVFTLSSPQSVSFHLGSDDDSFMYVDGSLIAQLPGVHSFNSGDFSSPMLAAGSHSLAVFYADRARTEAVLSLNLLSSGVTITPPPVPEPTSLALLTVGLAALGLSRRKRAI